MITFRDLGDGSTINISFENLTSQLRDKAKQILQGRENKYQDALIQLKSAKSVSDVQKILSNNDVNFKNKKIMGGKKTKKNRKQKGGFIYKTTSRKRISTNSKRSKSSKSSKKTIL